MYSVHAASSSRFPRSGTPYNAAVASVPARVACWQLDYSASNTDSDGGIFASSSARLHHRHHHNHHCHRDHHHYASPRIAFIARPMIGEMMLPKPPQT